jgi:hypothetical protein
LLYTRSQHEPPAPEDRSVNSVGGHEYHAIEQNPEKLTRWGQLARSGHRVVQFKDVESNRFVAVAVDGEVTFYGASEKRQ